jgi:hypothetical protein
MASYDEYLLQYLSKFSESCDSHGNSEASSKILPGAVVMLGRCSWKSLWDSRSSQPMVARQRGHPRRVNTPHPSISNLHILGATIATATTSTTCRPPFPTLASVAGICHYNSCTIPHPESSFTMATRTLEARFERMSVNDENDHSDNGRLYQKPKVRQQLIQPFGHSYS